MRKVCAWIVLALITVTLVGCGAKKEEKKEINIQGPDGKGVKIEVK